MTKRTNKTEKLAPLDHIKILYDGAAAKMKASSADGSRRRIVQKKDLLEAVRSMHVENGSRLGISRSAQALPTTMTQYKSETKNNNNNNLPALEGKDAPVRFRSSQEILQDALNENARKFNDLKVEVEARTSELKDLMYELQLHKLENESLQKMENHETRDTVRIDDLNQQIAQSLAELEAKQFRKTQLEYMKNRLVKNQVEFDAHIKGIEDALRASTREFEEVKLLMHQLEVGNMQAQDSLRQTMDAIQKQRDLRNKQMQTRRQEAENAKRMEEWRNERERQRQELEAELRGDLSEERERKLIAKVSETENRDVALLKLQQRAMQRVSTYEEAFAAIREATGVRTLDEMVEKFLGQGANKAALLEEKEDAEQRQRQIREDMARVQKEFHDLKAAGIGGSELNREMYDRLDDQILRTRQELKMKRATCARLDHVLVQVRAGMAGLTQRLEPFSSLLPPEDDVNIEQTGVESLDAMLTCEAKLIKLLDAISSTNDSFSANFYHGFEQSRKLIHHQPDNTNVWEQLDAQQPDNVLHANNIRVQPKLQTTARVDNNVDENDRDEEDEDGQVLDAHQVKKAAKAFVHKELDKQKHMDQRRQMISNLKSRQSQDIAAQRLSTPNKHQDLRARDTAYIGNRPGLV